MADKEWKSLTCCVWQWGLYETQIPPLALLCMEPRNYEQVRVAKRSGSAIGLAKWKAGAQVHRISETVTGHRSHAIVILIIELKMCQCFRLCTYRRRAGWGTGRRQGLFIIIGQFHGAHPHVSCREKPTVVHRTWRCCNHTWMTSSIQTALRFQQRNFSGLLWAIEGNWYSWPWNCFL
jgi:hypothetical protein